MTLCLTVPDDKDGLVHQLLPLGAGQPITTHVDDVPDLLSLQPLTRELYVDAGTPATLAQENGSIAFPFATVQRGVDALALVGGGVLLIAPGVYAEAVTGGPLGDAIDFVNLGAGVGGVVSITSIALQGGAVSLIGISVNTITIGSTTAAVRLDRSTVVGTLACAALTAIVSTVGFTVTCAGLTANDSNFNGIVNATGTLLLRNVTVLAALSTTVAASTSRLDNCRIGTTYTANGVGATTVARGCIFGLAVSATTVDLAGCTLSDQLTTSGAATVRFSSIAQQFTCGAAATLYQARLGNVSSIVGQLFTDFASIAGVTPVLSYGSIVIQQTTPRITLVVPVPAVAAGAVGYVNVSLVGSDLEGMLTADSLIVASPTVDLIAAGAGGGYINVRFNAANSIRFAFVGPLLVGNRDFIVGLV